ncbi:peptidoglycan-recognition protein 3-like isoform X1 [Macrosteles quadrilineatus]|uniref:peptidoglycan-recognition protein 3-like isoform X1 n=1 Tax=Macrosteles quadrilineatus TaxID=74068 RepID=UPI0023E0F8D4|nr:peptidoglycan-recognition protein 3-like isoform X1 [Macrosteles quadrilineatus]
MVIDLNRPFEILPLKLVPRAEWGAQAATSRERYKEYPIRWVVVRFTESEECFSKEECSKVLQRLQREQMEQGLTDIKHNFMVGGDWSVYEGRGWKYKAGDPLTPDVEGVCLDVGYIGPSPQIRQINYPSIEMKNAYHRILEFGVNHGLVDRNFNTDSEFSSDRIHAILDPYLVSDVLKGDD